MAASIAMMIGGAIVNAFAFTGGNFLFSTLGRNDESAKIEQARHNKAMEQQQAATAAYGRKKERNGWIGLTNNSDVKSMRLKRFKM